MKYLRIIFLVSALSFATAALAQGSGAPAGSSAPQAQTTQQPAPSVSGAIDQQITIVERNLVSAAEAMPEDKYNFTPASLNIKGAAYGDVRTFAQLIKHTATANYRFWSLISGDKIPDNIKGTNGPDELKTKAEIVQFLKDSFAVGHRAAKALTAENMLEEVSMFGRKAPKLFVASFTAIHVADEYGQVVEYLRMNGITPPASQR